MARRGLSDEEVLDGLMLFAHTHLVAGGSLRVKAYNAWVIAPVSFSAITKRFGDNSWTTVLLRFRAEMLEQANDPDAVAAELPVPCQGNVGISWMPGRIGDWLSLQCVCDACQSPPLRVAYPGLVSRLADPADADKGASLWFAWACPERRPNHRPFKAPAQQMANGKVYCADCRARDRFYRQYPIGTLKHNPDVERSKLEAPVAEALRALIPGERFATQQSVVIGPDYADIVGRAITPDIIMFKRKLAIEIDGGDGNSPRYSAHDTAIGAGIDTKRDHALASLGWTTIRLRHPGALPLAGSPATVVPCASRSPKVIAAALAPAIQSLLTSAGS